MHPKNISIASYSYSLPEEKIAFYPPAQRDQSKLLISKNSIITEDVYKNIALHLPENSLLLFNDTRVVEARLLFQKSTGGVIEIFCLEPDEQYPDINKAMQQTGKVYWRCLVGGASKWKHGQVLEKELLIDEQAVLLQAIYKEKRDGSFLIEFSWSAAALSFAELLHYAGAIPLPPYIKRKADSADTERYQTIYAQQDGSVAAPTAGLHFTNSVFESLKQKNIQKDFVTLHVGAGTFKPVKADTMEEHEMHAEFIDVSAEIIEKLIKKTSDNIIPVGTTSLRTIESLYWLGVKWLTEKQSPLKGLAQWEIYDLPAQSVTAQTALEALLQWMKENNTRRLVTKTRIIIAPGYQFRIAKALVTNFHQPQSTLLLLVAAMVGKNWKAIYEYALTHDFRFLSYGDGSLLWKTEEEIR